MATNMKRIAKIMELLAMLENIKFLGIKDDGDRIYASFTVYGKEIVVEIYGDGLGYARAVVKKLMELKS